MRIEIDDTYLSAFTGADDPNPYYRPESVYVGHPYDGEYPEVNLTPTQARELAAALLRNADEAEGRESGDGENMYAAGERSGYADWEFAFMDILPATVDGDSPSAVAAWVRASLEGK